MDIKFGYVQEYNVERGFGYVSCTFNRPQRRHQDFRRRHRDNVWFHIKTVRRDYPDTARELDAGSFTNVSFWYELDSSNNNRVSVSQLWLEPQDIPQQKRDGLVTYIEQQWRNTNALPEWLDLVTLRVLGEVRRNELQQIYDEQIRQHHEAEEQRRLQRQSLAAQIMAQRRSRILSARERYRTERGVIESIFVGNELHGLPPELQRIVRYCPRPSRPNPLSHEPGGSDVVVAYSLGDAILYDWVKYVDRYIAAFQREDPDFHLHIESIYGRFCVDQEERAIGVFCPIWARERDGALESAVQACVSRYQRQMQIGYKTLHQEAKEYWKNRYGFSEQEVENLPTLYKQYMREQRSSTSMVRSLIESVRERNSLPPI